MGSIACLSLIMYMEALNQSNYTKALVADVAIERASQEGFSICKSMKVKKSYSWMWDGKNTRVNRKLLEGLKPIAVKELKKPMVTGRYFFNECTMGKRWKTKYNMIRSEKLCFY
jgi:spore germination cell wall hydrolase CwlJ-like protein